MPVLGATAIQHQRRVNIDFAVAMVVFADADTQQTDADTVIVATTNTERRLA